MALTLSATQVGLKVDEMSLSFSGTLNTTVSSIDIQLIDPLGETFTVTSYAPDQENIPVTGDFSFTLTPVNMGLTTTYFLDGAYSAIVTVNYSDATDEVVQDYSMHNNRARRAWKTWVEKVACLNGGCGCEDCGTTISEVRELIQGGVIFFENASFNSARELFVCARELAEGKI